ncbi:MAG: hypothetical protein FWF43_10045 [Propionibacteriaceae bacterium]|nr:hypothetical protein [Propionibacteriaceae bacterium]
MDGLKRLYLHLFYSPARATAQEADFADLLARLHTDLTTGEVTEDDQHPYKSYFTKTCSGRTGNNQAIQAQRNRHGHFALLSNDVAHAA